MHQYLEEISKRRLWQVLLIFLGGAAVVLWVVARLTATVGLPSWTPTMAFVLLLIALPFTLAAAFVRETETDSTNPLSGLIAELHRRSLWQVMGIFLAGSWGALQVAEVMTETAGLPGWTPTMALVLLLIGSRSVWGRRSSRRGCLVWLVGAPRKPRQLHDQVNARAYPDS